MVYRIAIVLSLFFVASCGISETKYGKEFFRLNCEKQNECSGSSNDCGEPEEVTDGEAEYECDYDKKKAKDCLSELEVAECSDSSYMVPEVCSEVVLDCQPK